MGKIFEELVGDAALREFDSEEIKEDLQLEALHRFLVTNYLQATYFSV